MYFENEMMELEWLISILEISTYTRLRCKVMKTIWYIQ